MAEAHGGMIHSLETVAGGSALEAFGGLGTAVLAILGLANVLPQFLAAVAVIALGVALFSEGGALAARFRRVLSEAGGGRYDAAELGGGITSELLAGGAGVILGILALLGIVPAVLTSAAVVVFGASLVFGSGATATVNTFASHSEGVSHSVAREAVRAAAGAQVLIGVGAIVLGVIGLVGIHPMTLALVALLGLGASVLLSGSAIASRMLSALEV
jgi:hypothetical protein